MQKPIDFVAVPPPPPEQAVGRQAAFAAAGTRRTRYSLPESLDSASPVGLRTRVSLTPEEAAFALSLLSLERPAAFEQTGPVAESELFEEVSLGLLTARQSTNFRGHRETILGPDQQAEVAEILGKLEGRVAPVLSNASYSHIVFSRPYRTAFTMLLTLVGHDRLTSPVGVLKRVWKKKVRHGDDIPSIGYLQHLHLGVLADAMERATVIASKGARRALIHCAPFSGDWRLANGQGIARLEKLCGLTLADKARGWRVALVAQVGGVTESQRLTAPDATWRKVGANLMAFRSERIQPGVNNEDSAPAPYQSRQEMDIPEELAVQAGRAAYNAFSHWTGCDRERSKSLLLLDRVDVLTATGKQRLRSIRKQLSDVTDRVVENIPPWADLPTGRAFTRNAGRGRKAFALAGQRIYIGGLSRTEIEREGVDWELAIRGVGAAASRAGLVAEICGATDIPRGSDLLAGVCLMAGPVNQNDIGKAWFGEKDLLADAYPNLDPTSLLVWTLKAKTVSDPVGNEEQLLNASRKGALVDLRPGPHEVVTVLRKGAFEPMRLREGRTNVERAFSDVRNFVSDAVGRGVPGNRGAEWPWRRESVW